MTPDEYLQQLHEVAASSIGKVIAVGEFGLGWWECGVFMVSVQISFA
jgi:hypothetical protein